MREFRMVPAVLALLTLTGCGVDGEPVQPTLNAGVSINSSGVSPQVGVGLQQGPLSIFFGL